MEKIHNFKESLVIGELGEVKILDYLQRSAAVENIIDVRDNKMYRDIDVDLLVQMATGMELKLEIKTDTYRSGNMYYETVSAEETGSIGGFEKTQADYMFYYFINLQTLYILEMNEYRNWFGSKKEEFDFLGYQKKPKNARWNGSTYTSVGYAFPVSILENENPKWMRKVYLN